MQLHRGVLNLVVVKDPYFWAASMRRIRFQAPLDTADLSAPFRYQGRVLRGIAHYWNAHMATLDRFPAANTRVLRSSDLLFRWDEVVAALRQLLHEKPGTDFSETARLRDVATEEDPRSRGLLEARAFYAEPRNRVKGFSDAELRHMQQELDPVIMARWGYRHPSGLSGGPLPSPEGVTGETPPAKACEVGVGVPNACGLGWCISTRPVRHRTPSGGPPCLEQEASPRRWRANGSPTHAPTRPRLSPIGPGAATKGPRRNASRTARCAAGSQAHAPKTAPTSQGSARARGGGAGGTCEPPEAPPQNLTPPAAGVRVSGAMDFALLPPPPAFGFYVLLIYANLFYDLESFPDQNHCSPSLNQSIDALATIFSIFTENTYSGNNDIQHL